MDNKFNTDMSDDKRRKVESSMRNVIAYFDNPNREGLRDTPRRYIKFLEEFLNPPEFNMTTFDSEGYDQMIVQKDIPFYSLCEHHLAPFVGKATVAYVPKTQIVGLSKLARTVEMFSRRFQNQERITQQVADYLMDNLDPIGVAVSLSAEHFCMCMRGVKKHGVMTTTSTLKGCFKDNPDTRNEFINL